MLEKADHNEYCLTFLGEAAQRNLEHDLYTVFEQSQIASQLKKSFFRNDITQGCPIKFTMFHGAKCLKDPSG